MSTLYKEMNVCQVRSLEKDHMVQADKLYDKLQII